MAKKVARKAAGDRGKSWLEIVGEMRKCTERDLFRLKVLNNTADWEEFSSSWLSIGRDIIQGHLPDAMYPGRNVINDKLAWSWDQIEKTGAVDASLEAVHSATSLSGICILQAFDIMRSNMLLFPDGHMHDYVSERIICGAQSEQLAWQMRATARTIKETQLQGQLNKLLNRDDA